MKVLFVNGSPHKNGCTYTAMNEVCKQLEKHGIESEILWLGTASMQGCIACNTCYKKGECVFDDLVNETNRRADEFDALVVGGPVFYGGICAQLTAFLDRLFYSGGEKWQKKPGSCIVSCRRGGNTVAYQRLLMYFGINNMPIVTSQYWNEVHGRKAEDVLKDEEGLQVMRTLGENMAWMLKNIQAGKEAGVPEPVYEKRISTNFIR